MERVKGIESSAQSKLNESNSETVQILLFPTFLNESHTVSVNLLVGIAPQFIRLSLLDSIAFGIELSET